MSYGYIVLAGTKKGLLPNGIKWFTNSKFSHSLVTIPEILGVPMCIEAGSMGVDAARFDKGYVLNSNQIYEVWEINLEQSVKDIALVELLDDLEINYGYLEYPWFVWRRICFLFGKDIKKQNNWNTNGMICSQVCVAYLTSCGLGEVFCGYGRGSIAPQDLQDIMISFPTVFKKIDKKL